MRDFRFLRTRKSSLKRLVQRAEVPAPTQGQQMLNKACTAELGAPVRVDPDCNGFVWQEEMKKNERRRNALQWAAKNLSKYQHSNDQPTNLSRAKRHYCKVKWTNVFKHRAGRIGASQKKKAAAHSDQALPSQSLIQRIFYPELHKINTKGCASWVPAWSLCDLCFWGIFEENSWEL